jgi:hypothetical protein
MCHLMEDQPTPEICARQVGLTRPLFDIGLDEVKPVSRNRLSPQQLRVVLAKDPAAQEPEHEADVTIEPGPTHVDDQRVRDAAAFEDRVHDPAKDVKVELEPALAIHGLEAGQLDADRQPTHEVEQRFLELVGHRPIALLGCGKRCRGRCRIVEVGPS